VNLLTKTFPSGQEVVNPGGEPVLLTIRRCAGASHSGSFQTAACGRSAKCASPAFCSGSRRSLRVPPPSAPRNKPPLPAVVLSDGLARANDEAGDQGTTSGAPVLEVRRTFEPGRLAAACLAAAYAQVVPVHQRVGVSDVAESAAARVVDANGAPLRGSSEGRRS
jgi:hypothetical protein